MVPVVSDFLAQFPEINVRMTLSDRNVNLLEDHVDMAARVGALPDSSMMAIRVGALRRVVCASPAYLAARGTPHTPDDLAGHDCITNAGFVSPDVWTFVRDKTNVAVPVHVRFSVGSNCSTRD